MKKTIIALLAFIIVFSFASCEKEPEIVKVDKVEFITELPKTIYVGDTFSMKVKVAPDNASDKAVSWTSSDPSVFTVDPAGNVKALKEGKATLKAEAKDGSGAKAEIEVSVNKFIYVESIEFASSVPSAFRSGDSFDMSLKVLPANATNPLIIWSSSDDTKLSVDENGKVTANAEGMAVLKAEAADGSGISKEIEISVLPPIYPVEEIRLSSALPEKVCVDDSFTIAIEVLPENASNKNVKWTSSSNILRVNKDGKVYASEKGNVTVTVEAKDGSGVKKEFSFEIAEKPIPALSSVKISANNKKSYPVGIKTELEVMLTPSGAAHDAFQWESSNTDVATINERGVLETLTVGTTKITVSSLVNPQIKDSIDLTVENKAVIDISNDNDPFFGVFTGILENSAYSFNPNLSGVYDLYTGWGKTKLYNDADKKALEDKILLKAKAAITDADREPLTAEFIEPTDPEVHTLLKLTFNDVYKTFELTGTNDGKWKAEMVYTTAGETTTMAIENDDNGEPWMVRTYTYNGKPSSITAINKGKNLEPLKDVYVRQIEVDGFDEYVKSHYIPLSGTIPYDLGEIASVGDVFTETKFNGTIVDQEKVVYKSTDWLVVKSIIEGGDSFEFYHIGDDAYSLDTEFVSLLPAGIGTITIGPRSGGEFSITPDIIINDNSNKSMMVIDINSEDFLKKMQEITNTPPEGWNMNEHFLVCDNGMKWHVYAGIFIASGNAYNAVRGMIYKAPLEGISINIGDKIPLNKPISLIVKGIPDTAVVGEYSVSFTPQDIAVYENGYIKGLKKGNCTIIVTDGEFTDTCEVTIGDFYEVEDVQRCISDALELPIMIKEVDLNAFADEYLGKSFVYNEDQDFEFLEFHEIPHTLERNKDNTKLALDEIEMTSYADGSFDIVCPMNDLAIHMKIVEDEVDGRYAHILVKQDNVTFDDISHRMPADIPDYDMGKDWFDKQIFTEGPTTWTKIYYYDYSNSNDIFNISEIASGDKRYEFSTVENHDNVTTSSSYPYVTKEWIVMDEKDSDYDKVTYSFFNLNAEGDMYDEAFIKLFPAGAKEHLENVERYHEGTINLKRPSFKLICDNVNQYITINYKSSMGGDPFTELCKLVEGDAGWTKNGPYYRSGNNEIKIDKNALAITMTGETYKAMKKLLLNEK